MCYVFRDLFSIFVYGMVAVYLLSQGLQHSKAREQ